MLKTIIIAMFIGLSFFAHAGDELVNELQEETIQLWPEEELSQEQVELKMIAQLKKEAKWKQQFLSGLERTFATAREQNNLESFVSLQQYSQLFERFVYHLIGDSELKQDNLLFVDQVLWRMSEIFVRFEADFLDHARPMREMIESSWRVALAVLLHHPGSTEEKTHWAKSIKALFQLRQDFMRIRVEIVTGKSAEVIDPVLKEIEASHKRLEGHAKDFTFLLEHLPSLNELSLSDLSKWVDHPAWKQLERVKVSSGRFDRAYP